MKHPLFITGLLLSLLRNLRAIELRSHIRNVLNFGIVAHRIAWVSRLNRTTIEPSTEEPGEQEQDRSDLLNTPRYTEKLVRKI